jgi:hypothetical protein
MIFMVSLLSCDDQQVVWEHPVRPSVLLHRTICDGPEMGSALPSGNRPSLHMIYAVTAAKSVSRVIDWHSCSQDLIAAALAHFATLSKSQCRRIRIIPDGGKVHFRG